MSNRFFADLSNNNSEFDAETYRKKGGHLLVGLKVTEGVGFVDSLYHARCQAAHKAGLAVLHYHFGRPDLHHDAVLEAHTFLNVIDGHVGAHDFLVLDQETHGIDVKGHTKSFFDTISKHGPGNPDVLYTYASFFEQYKLTHKRKWKADYSGQIENIKRWNTLWAHQFTDGIQGADPHTCEGIGQCDVSVINPQTYKHLESLAS